MALTNVQHQKNRKDALQAAAESFGFPTWSAMLTAIKNKKAIVIPAEMAELKGFVLLDKDRVRVRYDMEGDPFYLYKLTSPGVPVTISAQPD